MLKNSDQKSSILKRFLVFATLAALVVAAVIAGFFCAAKRRRIQKLKTLEGGQPLPDFVVEEFVRQIGERAYVLKNMGKALLSPDKSMDGKLQNVKMPTLNVCGKEDKLIPVSAAAKLQKQIPQARIEIFENCGRTVLWTCVEQVIPKIQMFLNQLSLKMLPKT